LVVPTSKFRFFLRPDVHTFGFSLQLVGLDEQRWRVLFALKLVKRGSQQVLWIYVLNAH
jgi:hypothetical protein